jgi:hypothetical protein
LTKGRASVGASPVDFQQLNVYKIVTSDRPALWSRSGALAFSALQRGFGYGIVCAAVARLGRVVDGGKSVVVDRAQK